MASLLPALLLHSSLCRGGRLADQGPLVQINHIGYLPICFVKKVFLVVGSDRDDRGR